MACIYPMRLIIRVLMFLLSCRNNLQNTKVCALCGLGRFGLELEHDAVSRSVFKPMKNYQSPTKFKPIFKSKATSITSSAYNTHEHLRNFMYTDEQERCVWCCTTCNHTPATRCQYNVVYPDNSFVSMLYETPFEILHMMSCIDIRYTFASCVKGFARGCFGNKRLIDAPLMWFRSKSSRCSMLGKRMHERVVKIMTTLTRHCPVLTVVEPHFLKLYTAPYRTWKAIADKHRTKDPRPIEEQEQGHEHSENTHLGFIDEVTNVSPEPLIGAAKLKGCTRKVPAKTGAHFQVDFNGVKYSVEQAMYPYFFPSGSGSWEQKDSGAGSRFSLLDYWHHRFNGLFTIFTYHSEYLLLLYNKVATLNAASALKRFSVPKTAYEGLKKQYPDMSQPDIFKKLAHTELPAEHMFSHRYFRKEYNNLLRITREQKRPPDFLITITANENSKKTALEYKSLQDYLDLFLNKKWQKYPAECSRIFIAKIKLILDMFILGGEFIFGDVADYALKWETQNRGSLHVHLVIWLKHKQDFHRTCAGIMSYAPCRRVEGENGTVYQPPPLGTIAREVYELFHNCQKHYCSDQTCLKKGKCSKHFPVPIHESSIPKMRKGTKRYTYTCFYEHDRYFSPTHWLLALICQSHTNMQICVPEAWSVYLLKYTFKPLPDGALSFADPSLDQCLQLDILDPLVRKVAIASTHLTPICVNDISLVATGTPLTQLSRDVSYVECKTPMCRTVVVCPEKRTKHMCGTNSMTQYHHRIHDVVRLDCGEINMSTISFQKYHEHFYVASKPQMRKAYERQFSQPLYAAYSSNFRGQLCPSETPFQEDTDLQGREFIGYDNWGDMVFIRSQKELVRFTRVNPVHDIEEFAFYVLCKYVSFDNELELQVNGSYVKAAVEKFHLLDTDDLIESELDDFHSCHYSRNRDYQTEVHMIKQLISESMSKPPILPSFQIDQVDTERAENIRQQTRPHILNTVLDDDQEKIHSSLLESCGLHIITGGPGTGKSFLTKRLIHSLAHRGVMISASTAKAARLLSTAFGRTVHLNYAFHGKMPRCKQRSSPTAKKLAEIARCRVHIIDEFSMLDQKTFNNMLHTVMIQQHLTSFEEVLEKNLILLVGDHCQLPTVCNCKKAKRFGICGTHSVLAHKLFRNSYSSGRIHNLRTNHRSTTWAHVLDYIRNNDDITDAWVNENVNSVLKTTEELPQCLKHFQAICSHRDRVEYWNYELLRHDFPESEIHPVFPRVEASAFQADGGQDHTKTYPLDPDRLSDIERTIVTNKARFNQNRSHIRLCAVGAPVRIVENIDQQCGFVNGATTVITGVGIKNGYVTEIEVDIEGHKRYLKQYVPSKQFVDERYLRWWPIPVVLDYSGTVHAYQGRSMNSPHIIDIKDAFELGLAYTALSRTVDPDLIYLKHHLTAADLKVANLDNFYAWLDAHVKDQDGEDLELDWE